MKRNIKGSLITLTLLIAGLLASACSSNTGHEGTHQMGSAPMSNEKMPGKPPQQ
jgi:hypothetical protein